MANVVRKFEINPGQIRPVQGEIARGLMADQIVDLFDVLSGFIMGKPLLIIFKTVEISLYKAQVLSKIGFHMYLFACKF